MTGVFGTDEFEKWYAGLSEAEMDGVDYCVGLLEQLGVNLGFPYSSKLQGSKHKLRELRAQAAGKPLRVFYAFDPRRDAILILGGEKGGDSRFYEKVLPRAEKIWEQYLKEFAEGFSDE